MFNLHFKNPFYFHSPGNACTISTISGQAKYKNNKNRLIVNFSSNDEGKDALFKCQIDDGPFCHCELFINIYLAMYAFLHTIYWGAKNIFLKLTNIIYKKNFC